MIKKTTNNTYDIFLNKGYEDWIRIHWDHANRKWEYKGGNRSLFSKAISFFNEQNGKA